MLTIKTENTTRIVAGKLVQETFSYVADEAGNLVGRKAHTTPEDAQAELAGLGGFAEGLEFAKAQFPELSEKALVGKANVIAEFLAWQSAGKPMKEAKVTGPDSATDVPEQPEGGSEETF